MNEIIKGLEAKDIIGECCGRPKIRRDRSQEGLV